MAAETHGAAAAEHAQGMPQLDFSTYPNQIFWLVVTLVVIYFVLTRIALPRIASVLSERASTIAADLARAEELRKQAADAEEAYNKALADARAEAQAIIARAKAEMQAELDAAMAEADAQIAEKLKESEARIAEIRASAMQSVADVARETAEVLVEALMPQLKVGKADIEAAVAKQLEG